eukprot:364509-Chlamydomonas_euryale.AAC.5
MKSGVDARRSGAGRKGDEVCLKGGRDRRKAERERDRIRARGGRQVTCDGGRQDTRDGERHDLA